MTAYTTYYDESPCGRLLLVVAGDGALERIEFLEARELSEVEQQLERKLGTRLEESQERTVEVRAELDEYFAGQRQEFDVELRPAGTDFQQKVWRELNRIPFGALSSYGQIARTLGRPNASRAVGRAVGTNPIPVIIPCHRVVGADQSLTGFGGGIPAKVALLELEGHSVREGFVCQPGLF